MAREARSICKPRHPASGRQARKNRMFFTTKDTKGTKKCIPHLPKDCYWHLRGLRALRGADRLVRTCLRWAARRGPSTIHGTQRQPCLLPLGGLCDLLLRSRTWPRGSDTLGAALEIVDSGIAIFGLMLNFVPDCRFDDQGFLPHPARWGGRPRSQVSGRGHLLLHPRPHAARSGRRVSPIYLHVAARRSHRTAGGRDRR